MASLACISCASCPSAFALKLPPPSRNSGPRRAISLIVGFKVEDRRAVVRIKSFDRQDSAFLAEELHERESDWIGAMRGSCCEDADLLEVKPSPRVDFQPVAWLGHLV